MRQKKGGDSKANCLGEFSDIVNFMPGDYILERKIFILYDMYDLGS